MSLFILPHPVNFAQNNDVDSNVPGITVAHIPASSKKYIGSPSIVVLPNGDYITSHDYFGPDDQRAIYDETIIYKSSNQGETWGKVATLKGQWWSTLFVFKEDLYIIGTRGAGGDIVIRKSTDGGNKWTEPLDEKTGTIAKGTYHCAPVPVIVYNGRIWRAMEKTVNSSFQALMISAPIEKDLLKSSSWTFSNGVGVSRHWYNQNMESWREGNAVVKADGQMANLIRVEISGEHDVAALLDVSEDGKVISFNPYNGFVKFPDGVGKKFTVRFDVESDKYWAVSNWIQPKDLYLLKNKEAGSIRNTIILVSSKDLKDWTIERILLHHPDHVKHAFQYPDWVYDNSDIIMVSRTCYDDGVGGAPNHHDANFMTFHRVKDFRNNLHNAT